MGFHPPAPCGGGRKSKVPHVGRVGRAKCCSRPKTEEEQLLSLLRGRRNKELCGGQAFSSAWVTFTSWGSGVHLILLSSLGFAGAKAITWGRLETKTDERQEGKDPPPPSGLVLGPPHPRPPGKS